MSWPERADSEKILGNQCLFCRLTSAVWVKSGFKHLRGTVYHAYLLLKSARVCAYAPPPASLKTSSRVWIRLTVNLFSLFCAFPQHSEHERPEAWPQGSTEQMCRTPVMYKQLTLLHFNSFHLSIFFL